MEAWKHSEVVARQKKGAKRVPKAVEGAKGRDESQVQLYTLKKLFLLQV